ncbi:MAG: beta-eliminating lyase-related protein, partial [Bacteroidota bacterium]
LNGMFDSISVCISKGLGAPAGSVLLGSKDFIKRSRKIRKVMGGGMRQSGMLAAACIYALEHNIERLKDDHQRAKQLAEVLRPLSWVKKVLPVETNIVIFEVKNSAVMAEQLAKHNIRIQPFSPTLLRMVTHLDFTDDMLGKTITALQQLVP